jgi:hypothetical protein
VTVTVTVTVCRADVFPKVGRTLIMSENHLHQGVEVSSGTLSHASGGWRETKSADTGVVVGAHGKACGRCERVSYKLMLPSGRARLRPLGELPCDKTQGSAATTASRGSRGLACVSTSWHTFCKGPRLRKIKPPTHRTHRTHGTAQATFVHAIVFPY